MAEVAELHPFDAEDEEIDEEAAPWPLPCAPAPPFNPDVHQHRSGDRSFNLGGGGGGRGLAWGDSDVFLPVFSPQIRYFSEHLDHRVPWDSNSDSSYVDDPVTLGLDVFEPRSPPHESGGGGRGTGAVPFSDSLDRLCLGVLDRVEDMGSDYLELGLGFGLGPEQTEEDEEGGAGVTLEDPERLDSRGDGFFVGGRRLGSDGAGGEPSGSREGEGLRVLGFGSDSDFGEEVEFASRMRTDSDSGDAQEVMFDDLGLPFCWDCLRIEEERRDPNEDLDWEEVEVRVNGREILGTVVDSENISILQQEEENDDDDAEEANTALELEEVDEETGHNVEWEVLLAENNVDTNASVENEDAESYLGEENSDYVYNSEYEVLFEQFADHENFIKGSPPAAKLVIERLPSVVLTQLDVANNNMICAVCKDEFSLEEKAKQLPCSHHYHTHCILPWLRIRNTCPVCRYELPTDDPNYEYWRASRAGRAGAVQDSQPRYEFEIFP